LGISNNYGFPSKNIVIIDDCQELKEDSMNALLKNLEEPGAHTVFILVASGKVSDTISSRCQVLNFSRLSKENLLEIAKINFLELKSLIKNFRRKSKKYSVDCAAKNQNFNRWATVGGEIFSRAIRGCVGYMPSPCSFSSKSRNTVAAWGHFHRFR
jgi:glutamine phosphoribosylpyrophosphate amidotransferase